MGIAQSQLSYRTPQVIGVSGIMARIDKGVTVTVEETQPNTPAAGKFNKNDIIVGVNGVLLKGKHPWVVLGTALTEAEAKDGVLTFDITAGKTGVAKQVTITIPVLGAYSKTFPLNCDKSKKIIQEAAEFYAGKDRMKKHGFLDGLACLFLLSTGDDRYVPRVKEYFSHFLGAGWERQGIGRMTWNNGYNGVAVRRVLPEDGRPVRTADSAVLLR